VKINEVEFGTLQKVSNEELLSLYSCLYQLSNFPKLRIIASLRYKLVADELESRKLEYNSSLKEQNALRGFESFSLEKLTDRELKKRDLFLHQLMEKFETDELQNYKQVLNAHEFVLLECSKRKILHDKFKESTKIQTLILSKDKFKSTEAAKKWIEENDFVFHKVDETEDSYRFRQVEPSEFIDSSFRTINIANGVKAVIGKLKESKSLDLSGFVKTEK